MIRNKIERADIGAEALSKSEVVFSNFSAAQSNAKGFILVGTVHFNQGELIFEEGRAEFVLKRTNIVAQGSGCVCPYNSIAYITRSNEAHKIKAQLTKTAGNQKGRKRSAEAKAAVSGKSGLSLGGGLEGDLTEAFGEEQSRALSEDAEGTKSLITAMPKKRTEGGAKQIVWRIEPDPLIPYETSDNTYTALIGERMRAANEDAGLAKVDIVDPEGFLEIKLEVRAADIEWTDVEFSDRSRLHQHGKRLINGTTKRDIVGRLGLGKALEGSVLLQTLPKSSYNG
ncbi:MAG: hypothetical protein AAFQ87_16475 [Bacteroidota bacterium]